MDFTTIICSYKANKEFSLCLQRLVKYNVKNVIIYENSPEEYTSNRELLDRYKIPYINNPGGNHPETIDRALREVKTRYALILDSDCFLLTDPEKYINYCFTKNIQLFGDICGNRGGYRIHKRVHPWFCIVDVSFLNDNKINFLDKKRIEESNSQSFFDIKQLANKRDRKGFYYDVGSTMFEDIVNCGGTVADIGDNLPYIHKEGSSWYKDSNNSMFLEWDKLKAKWFENICLKLEFNEDNLFNYNKNKKYSEAVLLTKSYKKQDLIDWTNHYLNKCGFNHILIYDNESSFSVKELFKDNDKITVEEIKGFPNQNSLYDVIHSNSDYQWQFFVDSDEYLWFDKDKFNNVNEFLKTLDKNKVKCFGVYWTFMSYKEGEQKDKRLNSIISECQYVPEGEYLTHIKSFVNKDVKGKFLNPHMIYGNNVTITCDGNIIKDPRARRSNNEDFIKLFHFYKQSKEDWIRKSKQERADIQNQKYSLEMIEKNHPGNYIKLDKSLEEF